MPTNWTAPAGVDLAQVINWQVIFKANQNLAEPASLTEAERDGSATSTDEANRRDAIVQDVVAEVRAAIQTAGRSPLSVTADCVPPEAKRHVLNIAAWQLLNSTPNLNMAILTEKGVSTPFAKFYDEGVKFLDELRKGQGVTPPTDPTGRDYLTAVDDENLAICGTSWSDMRMTDDEFAAEEVAELDMTTD